MKRRLSFLVLVAFCFSLLAPIYAVPTATAVSVDGIHEMGQRMSEVYRFLDDSDKANINAARSGLNTLTDAQWNYVIAPLMDGDSKVADPGRFGSAANAREAVIDFAGGLAAITYSSDPSTLESTLTNFKNSNTASFEKLFGTGITVNELYLFLADNKANLPVAVESNGIAAKLVGANATNAAGAKADFVSGMHEAVKESMRLSLEGGFTEFRGKLDDIGWTVDELVTSQIRLAAIVDSNNSAEISMGQGAMRSQAVLTEVDANGDFLSTVNTSQPGSITVGSTKYYRLEILGYNFTNMCLWDYNSTYLTKNYASGNQQLTGKAAGTSTVTAYRDYGTVATNWLLKYPIQVTASQGGGGGGGAATPSFKADPGGNTITSGNLSIVIPPDAVGSEMAVFVAVMNQLTGLSFPTDWKVASDIVSITKLVERNFNKPITITLKYDKTKITDDMHLSIYWWDETNKKWVELDGVVVKKLAGTVSGQVTHFTKFAVIASPATPTKPPVNEQDTGLKDIKGHWAEANINKLVASGAISGYKDGTFLPEKKITRAEFATILIKALKLEAKAGKVFPDTKYHWAKNDIATAQAYGIITGYDNGKFGPDDPITREQMASMIVKAGKLVGTTGAKSFADDNKIAKWAQLSVRIATASKVMGGYQDNTFRPKELASRAEAVTVIINTLTY